MVSPVARGGAPELTGHVVVSLPVPRQKQDAVALVRGRAAVQLHNRGPQLRPRAHDAKVLLNLAGARQKLRTHARRGSGHTYIVESGRVRLRQVLLEKAGDVFEQELGGGGHRCEQGGGSSKCKVDGILHRESVSAKMEGKGGWGTGIARTQLCTLSTYLPTLLYRSTFEASELVGYCATRASVRLFGLLQASSLV